MEESKFKRVLGQKDIFAIAFGAMIGWSWVVMAGEWVTAAGTLGAIMAFLMGGIMVVFLGFIYAELTSAMPKCGGEHVFSQRAMGDLGSFICTWAIILGYVGVVAFEACAFPTVLQYIAPNFMVGYMYTIAGFDVYASWVAVGVIASIVITAVNCKGVKTAAKFQQILTVVIAAIGIALMVGSGFSGDLSNAEPLFENGFSGVLTVAVMTPFMFVGFDVIPQAAEEINVPFKKVGKIVLLSIVMAAVWYIAIIVAVSLVMSKEAMSTSTLVTADAMKAAFFNSDTMAKVVIIGGMAGIVTSWNSFFVGGSRAIYALAEAKMLPDFLAVLSKKNKVPVNAVVLIGVISSIAPFFGRAMMVWLTDAGSFGTVIAYFMVALSFVILRKKEPNMERPYKVKHGMLIGVLGILASGLMILLYIPGMSSGLVAQELVMVGGWIALGVVFFLIARAKHKLEEEKIERAMKSAAVQNK